MLNKKNKIVTVQIPSGGFIKIGNNGKLVLIAGPCAIESYDHSMKMVDLIDGICRKHNVNWIFKACYDKDCRSSPKSFHGLGIEEGLQVLSKVRKNSEIPICLI